jgi:asparagine synthase (glutamine-hydrolysing)
LCGIAGFLRKPDWSADRLTEAARAMSTAIAYRGPDSSGEWVEAESGLAFGHRRLAIIDLSPGGHQPMASADERWQITYNGEVFNYLELRAELEAAGCHFRSQSDTEVIIEGCARWGVEATARRLIGMFAYAVWDRRERRLFLVRDRLGKKPIYWTMQDGTLLFASELKALLAYPGFAPRLDREAATAYMRFGYVPAPRSIFAGVQKLLPGTILSYQPGSEPKTVPFWDLAEIVREARADPLDVSDDEAVEQLDALLRDAVRRRMMADVPLGAFLSGGIDSSSVVALMQAQSDRPVRSFSIGFPETGYDEAPHAKRIAAHLGTQHTELYVGAGEALAVVPRIAEMYDEPFSDSSQIPTFLVSEMTRRDVTVALSGDGGDELFGGYSRYLYAEQLWAGASATPLALRRLAAGTIETIPPAVWNVLFCTIPTRWRPRQPVSKLQKVARMLRLDSPDPLYRQLVSQWDELSGIVPSVREPRSRIETDDPGALLPEMLDRMRFFDMLTYLPDDILAKVDRASMAVSLEARTPLLDHRVVEFSWRLPRRFLVRDGESKWILRRVLERYVPRALFERPKMGFGVPLETWLRGPLRGWAEELLTPKVLGDDLVDLAVVRRRWDEHLSGSRDWQYPLWVVLVFAQWRQRYRL